MQCPACGSPLTEITTRGVIVDVCKGGCGGIWFDNFELKKFDAAHEPADDLIERLERDERIKVDHSKRRICPRCGSIPMMRHFSSVQQRVEIDECPNCGGCWLDAGELTLIRQEFRTEPERRQASDRYFDGLFKHDLARLKVQGVQQAARADRFSHMLAFLRPGFGRSSKAEQ
jgi:Zn-finger nucleic acid-binding protein